jgi:hypothetical protein
MKSILRYAWLVIGILLVFTGIIWILQGINILPGSFMMGQIEWAYYGALAVVFGALLILLRRRI